MAKTPDIPENGDITVEFLESLNKNALLGLAKDRLNIDIAPKTSKADVISILSDILGLNDEPAPEPAPAPPAKPGKVKTGLAAINDQYRSRMGL